MRARQPLLVAIIPMDVEPADTVHALELLEAVQRHLGRAGDELQQLGKLLLVEGADGAPEPLDLLGGSRVVVVLGVALPVVDVDVGQAGDEQLKLLLVELEEERMRHR